MQAIKLNQLDNNNDYRSRGLAENIRPRRTDFNILELDFENSAVDVMKALGWDWTVAGRQSVAMTLGYRGKLDSNDRSPMNDWLVKEINRRFGYELRDRLKKARAKAAGPVFTPLDWDAHMEEIEAAQEKPSPKKEPSKAPSDNMDYMTDAQRLDAKLAGLARLKKTPMVKNIRGVYETVKTMEIEAKSEKAARARAKTPKLTKKQKTLKIARDYLSEIDDWAAEELTESELNEEICVMIDDYADGDYNLSEEEIHCLIEDHWI